jgi:hypothetical protein
MAARARVHEGADQGVTDVPFTRLESTIESSAQSMAATRTKDRAHANGTGTRPTLRRKKDHSVRCLHPPLSPIDAARLRCFSVMRNH